MCKHFLCQIPVIDRWWEPIYKAFWKPSILESSYELSVLPCSRQISWQPVCHLCSPVWHSGYTREVLKRLAGICFADFLPLQISRISSLLYLGDFFLFYPGFPLSLVPFQLINISKRAYSTYRVLYFSWGTSCGVYCNENRIYVFLFWKLPGLSPNFHICLSVSDLYTPRISPHQQNWQTDPGNK